MARPDLIDFMGIPFGVLTGVVVVHRADRAAEVDTLCLSLAARGSYTEPSKTFTSPCTYAVRPRLDADADLDADQPLSTAAMASAVRPTLAVLSPATQMRPERIR